MEYLYVIEEVVKNNGKRREKYSGVESNRENKIKSLSILR